MLWQQHLLLTFPMVAMVDSGVLGMLDLLYMTNLESEQHGLVKIMQESAEGLMEVINNILDYCKIEAGRLELEEIDFSLRDTFEQVPLFIPFGGSVSDVGLLRSLYYSGGDYFWQHSSLTWSCVALKLMSF